MGRSFKKHMCREKIFSSVLLRKTLRRLCRLKAYIFEGCCGQGLFLQLRKVWIDTGKLFFAFESGPTFVACFPKVNNMKILSLLFIQAARASDVHTTPMHWYTVYSEWNIWHPSHSVWLQWKLKPFLAKSAACYVHISRGIILQAYIWPLDTFTACSRDIHSSWTYIRIWKGSCLVKRLPAPHIVRSSSANLRQDIWLFHSIFLNVRLRI